MKYSDRHISDEELDQLFRDAHASEGPEALFVPEFWSEMEAMLPAEPKKKRGLYWIPLASAFVLAGIVWFYPSHSEKVDRLVQNEKQSGNENEKQDEGLFVQSGKEKQLPVMAENSSVPSSEAAVNTQHINTSFRAPEKQVHTQSPGKRIKAFLAEEEPVNAIDGNNTQQTPENSIVLTPNPEADPHTVSHSHSELDSLNLEARYERVPHEEIAPLPEKTAQESNEWYAELGPTIGRSPYLSPDQKRNVVGGAVFGGGYIKRIDNAFVSFGLQGRLEGFGGLEYRETNFSPNITRTVSVKQLYSLEIPLKFGYTFRRSEFAVAVVPGVQLFIHGKEQIFENQVIQRERTFTGKVEHSNSLTMEFGLQYYYNFNPKWGVGAKVNADILRPFHTDYYLGKSAGFPVNGQIVLRRRFLK
ncbi:hypothetical protein [Fluviicola sp.]|uniref:hypothetical protein n=1 Tax=Fluviicola sp. TaxID=1917219 RepID=UPI0031DD9FE7